MKPRKLTEVELSMVLSRHADGRLKHDTFGYPSLPVGKPMYIPECGCVAGTVLHPGRTESDCMGVFQMPSRRACRMSDALSEAMDYGWDYPSDTDEMLRLLERAGLA